MPMETYLQLALDGNIRLAFPTNGDGTKMCNPVPPAPLPEREQSDS